MVVVFGMWLSLFEIHRCSNILHHHEIIAMTVLWFHNHGDDYSHNHLHDDHTNLLFLGLSSFDAGVYTRCFKLTKKDVYFLYSSPHSVEACM